MPLRPMGSVRLPTDAPDAPQPVPFKVSRMQAKQALLAAGLLATFDAAVAASGDDELKLYYAETSDFHRDHPALVAFMTARGMTDEQVDDLFRAAILFT